MGISFDVNVENEQVVLGALIADAEQRARFLPKLHDGLFVDPVSIAVLGALREIARRKVPYAADTVFQLAGGEVKFKYLQALERDFGALPDANLEVHLGILRRESAKERARESFDELFESLDDPHSSVEDVERNASSVLRAVRDGSAVGKIRRGKPLREEWFGELEGLAAGRGELFRPLFFTGLDEELYEGLRPGNLVVVAARPGMGKALDVATPVPTPSGWTTMGDIEVGDYVFGSDGCPTRVDWAGLVAFGRPCFEVRFSDGTSTVADAEHLWLTRTRAERRSTRSPGPSLRTTAEIAETLRTGSDDRINHSIESHPPLEQPEADLPVPPYTLGIWLGDGETAGGRISSADEEVVERIEADGFEVRKGADPVGWGVVGLKVRLREAGVLGDKHIPISYLRASERQRRELLAGLLDSDGYVENHGRTSRFDVTCKRLHDGVVELARTLGFRVGEGSRPVNGRKAETSTCFRLWFAPDCVAFALPRKSEFPEAPRTARSTRRFVEDVLPVDSVPVRCIKVSNDDGIFIVGRGFVPTHNTTFCSNLLLRQALRGKRWLSVPVEPGTEAVVEQMVCARARISAEKVIKSPDQLTKKELFAIKRAARELIDNEFIDFNDEMGSFDELEAAVDAADYDGVVIDLWEYLLDDLDPKVVTQRLRSLKKLAKRRHFCAVVVHQIKRIKRVKNPRPMLHELKNSGGYEEVADLAILLHRAKYYKPEVERDVLEMSIAKQRRGPQNVLVGFDFDPAICRVGGCVADFDPRDQQ